MQYLFSDKLAEIIRLQTWMPYNIQFIHITESKTTVNNLIVPLKVSGNVTRGYGRLGRFGHLVQFDPLLVLVGTCVIVSAHNEG